MSAEGDRSRTVLGPGWEGHGEKKKGSAFRLLRLGEARVSRVWGTGKIDLALNRGWRRMGLCWEIGWGERGEVRPLESVHSWSSVNGLMGDESVDLWEMSQLTHGR